MLKLLFSLEIVLLGVSSGIAILAPRYNTRIVRKSIVIRYNFNESLCLYNVVSNNSWMSGKQCLPWSVFAKSVQQMQDSCQTNWNFWQDKIKFCRTGGLSVIKLLSRFARNHRTFVRQTELFCRTEWKFAGFVRQSCSFCKDCLMGHHIFIWVYTVCSGLSGQGKVQ